jgi:hypothetical protein
MIPKPLFLPSLNSIATRKGKNDNSMILLNMWLEGVNGSIGEQFEVSPNSKSPALDNPPK